MRASLVVPLLFFASWIIAVVAILIGGAFLTSWRAARRSLFAAAPAASAIALCYLAAYFLGLGVNAGTIITGLFVAASFFCQALFGVMAARGVKGFAPFPVSRAVALHQRPFRQLALWVGIALLSVVAAFVLGAVGSFVAQAVGEPARMQSGASFFHGNKFQIFFLLLAGAGLAEEIIFRLLILTALWRLTGQKWLAIIVAALAFGAYHLTPLDSFYLTFWRYPLHQFLASAFIGLLWGYLYTRRGFETAVLGHTLSDWLPLFLPGN